MNTPLCACGCGQPVTKSSHNWGHWNKFVHGHNIKSPEHQALATEGKRRDEVRKATGERTKKMFANPDIKEKHRASITEIMHRPETQEYLRQRATAQMNNPESRAKWYAGSSSERARKLRSESMSRRLSEDEVKSKGIHGKFVSDKMQCVMSYASSFERRFMEWCEQSPDVIVFATYKFHKIRIPYFNPEKQFSVYYYPDFLIQLSNEQTYLCEVKAGWQVNTPLVQLKARVAIEVCKELGHRYLFITEHSLIKLESDPSHLQIFEG
jgi:hypothetical protein